MPGEAVSWRWPLPRDVRGALGDRRDLAQMLQAVDNPGLLLQRYLAYPGQDWGWKVGRTDYRGQAWQTLAQRLAAIYTAAQADTVLARALQQLHEGQEAAARALGLQCCALRAEVVWRLAIGLGLPSPLEVGLTLHHLYGFPYLPGSALKGVARHWAEQQGGQRDPVVIRAFGATDRQGAVVFFDAYPEALLIDGQPIVELDVMTPHYTPYYMQGEPPGDWHAPVPVFFLTLRKGARFVIRLAARDATLLQTVAGWVERALAESGIGAKTRAGYGELRIVRPASPSPTAATTARREESSSSQSRAATASPPPQVADAAAATLSLAVARWTAREMGSLPDLLERIAAWPDPRQRRAWAEALRQKLAQAGRWGGSDRERSWHQRLEALLREDSG